MFKKVKSSQAKLKLGLYGTSGSGKTLTALLIAEGLAKLSNKRIAMVDTERGADFYRLAIPERKVHPEAFDFDVEYTRSVSQATEAIQSMGSDYDIVILDSITHLWENCQDSYSGRRTASGKLPFHAWGKIKAPYKRLMRLFLDGDFHGIICGREGNVFEEDDEGELKMVGKKMKAEGETAYEPHILGRMIPERMEDGQHKVRVFFEKDRTGVLQGRTFEWPTFAVIEPVLKYLSGGEQPKTGDGVEIEQALAEEIEAKEQAEFNALFRTIRDALHAAKDENELRAAWGLTKGKKTKLGERFDELEVIKDTRKKEISGD